MTEQLAPAHPAPLAFNERVHLFGRFDFTSDPAPGNPEHVHVLGNWVAQNIVMVEIPELAELGLGRHMQLHRLVAPQFQRLFQLWKARGKLHLVKAYDGSHNTRFKRFNGTLEQRLARARTATPADLSNHAWGTAVDINARWNPLGAPPVPAGGEGSVLELVPEMEECGLVSGAFFHGRCDAMHIEARAVVKVA
jgi:hypothetical protein